MTLAHWRRTVAELYANVRRVSATDPESAWQQFCAEKDRLFATHPQTPLSIKQREPFTGLSYFSYDPVFRVTGTLAPITAAEPLTVQLPADGTFRYTPIAHVNFLLAGNSLNLTLFWIEGYGGGLFLPFKDTTSGTETYGGGRYLYDTIKGADLGTGEKTIPLDFNFAYNPSCAYNMQWMCPLSPPENRLSVAITAGEKQTVINI